MHQFYRKGCWCRPPTHSRINVLSLMVLLHDPVQSTVGRPAHWQQTHQTQDEPRQSGAHTGHQRGLTRTSGSERRGNNMKGFNNPESEGQTLAVSVLHVPGLLDSGSTADSAVDSPWQQVYRDHAGPFKPQSRSNLCGFGQHGGGRLHGH